MDYQRDEHRLHLVVYHLTWCPKRRKRVLVGPVATELERLLRAMFPGLKTMPSLWTRSFFASTAGTVSASTIQYSIQAQKGL